MFNPYADRSAESLKALRKDLLNVRRGHLRESDALLAEVRKVGAAIKDAEPEPLPVSDHAVIRWLERVEGMDIDALRLKIAGVAAEHNQTGGDHLIDCGGFFIAMTDNRITTILDKHMPLGKHPMDTRTPPPEGT